MTLLQFQLQLKQLNGLKRYFDEYDMDNNGTIKESEMAAVYQKHTGKKMPAKQQMQSTATNHDGLVDFEEYVEMMNSDVEQLNEVNKLNNS
jgi:Ca2+-binding EF-hand superfamily protein